MGLAWRMSTLPPDGRMGGALLEVPSEDDRLEMVGLQILQQPLQYLCPDQFWGSRGKEEGRKEEGREERF